MGQDPDPASQIHSRKVGEISKGLVGRGFSNGTMTFDGREILVSRWREKLSLFAVEDLSERVVSTDPRFLVAWSDSHTGGIFVLMSDNASTTHSFPYTSDWPCDLLYFKDRESLIAWKPEWQHSHVDLTCSGIQWVEGAQLFALFRNTAGSPSKTNTTLIDSVGETVGTFDVPGDMIGLDQGDSGLEAFYTTRARDSNFVVHRGVVNDQRNRLLSRTSLYSLDLSSYYLNHLCHGSYAFGRCGRGLRLRGSRAGEERRFATEILPSPTLWQARELPQVGTVKPLHRITGGSGVLASVESEKSYEIVSWAATPNRTPFLINRSGETIRLQMAENAYVVDAVFTDKTWVMTTIKVADRSIDRVQCFQVGVLTIDTKSEPSQK